MRKPHYVTLIVFVFVFALLISNLLLLGEMAESVNKTYIVTFHIIGYEEGLAGKILISSINEETIQSVNSSNVISEVVSVKLPPGNYIAVLVIPEVKLVGYSMFTVEDSNLEVEIALINLDDIEFKTVKVNLIFENKTSAENVKVTCIINGIGVIDETTSENGHAILNLPKFPCEVYAEKTTSEPNRIWKGTKLVMPEEKEITIILEKQEVSPTRPEDIPTLERPTPPPSKLATKTILVGILAVAFIATIIIITKIK